MDIVNTAAQIKNNVLNMLAMHKAGTQQTFLNSNAQKVCIRNPKENLSVTLCPIHHLTRAEISLKEDSLGVFPDLGPQYQCRMAGSMLNRFHVPNILWIKQIFFYLRVLVGKSVNNQNATLTLLYEN